MIYPWTNDDKNLIAHYNMQSYVFFNDNTKLADLSNNENDATLIGSPLFDTEEGDGKGYLYLNGINQYINISTLNDTKTTTDYSISLWTRKQTFDVSNTSTSNMLTPTTSKSQAYQTLISSTYNTANTNNLYLRSNNTMWELCFGSSSTTYTSSVTASINAPVYIGCRCDGNNFFNGYVDDIRIYNNNLTVKQIGELYNNGLDRHKKMWYGISVSKDNISFSRIGNIGMHADLPVQSGMRGCILDNNGNVIKYLDANSWSPSDTNGSLGNVMVEVPEHWKKFESVSSTSGKVKLSNYPIDGYIHVPTYYVSAYHVVKKTTNEYIESIATSSSTYDNGCGNTLTKYGYPCVNKMIQDFRNYAHNINTNIDNWQILTYGIYMDIFWLY